MVTNISQENVDVYTETPHRNMDEEDFVNDIKKKIDSDYKPQTMLSGIEWKDKVVIEFVCGAEAKASKTWIWRALRSLDWTVLQLK